MSISALNNFHYVNRIEQINMVKKSLNTIRGGQTVFNTVLEWYGIPGIGKTTISQLAIPELCPQMKIPFAFIDFDPEDNQNAEKYFKDHVLLIEDIFRQIGVDKPTDIKKALEKYREATEKETFLREERQKQVVNKFTDYVKEKLKTDPVVLIFDSTEKMNSDLSAWVEEKIISPLCLTGKCIIIWTGRFQQHWKKFEVRRRVVSRKLEPLLPEFTLKQVEDIGVVGIDVYRFTAGHPMANKKLAEKIKEDKNRQFEDQELINIVEGVIDKHAMRDVSTELKAACFVLSIVRQFDLGILKKLLLKFVSYYKDTENFLTIIGSLSETSLVEWDNVRKGYALDETIRYILSLHLSLNDPERYKDINEEALKIYGEWIERVPENRSIYILERLYHLAKIDVAQDQLQIEANLKQELKNFLKKYYKGDDIEFVYSAATRLYEELKKDNEFEKIVGKDGFVHLQEIVNNHRLTLEEDKRRETK